MARILIVDDDPDHLELAKAVLGKDHETETASNAGEALKRLRQGGIDALILDLMLPGVSGLDFAVGLREEDGVGGVPIVIWTACHITDSLEERLSGAFNVHSVLPKPCPPQSVAHVVDLMVGEVTRRRARGDFGVHSFGRARVEA